MSGLPKIVAIGLSAEEQRGLAALPSAQVTPADFEFRLPRSRDHRHALVFAGLDRAALATFLVQGFHYYIEWSDQAAAGAILQREPGHLILSLTTRSAFHSINGSAVAQMLVSHDLLPETLAPNIASAVQEAIANAVIHGNLGMHLDPSDLASDFMGFHEEVARRIASSEGVSRRVTICAVATANEVTVSVEDEGSGFSPSLNPVLSDAAWSGRGMMIMRAQTVRLDFKNQGRVAILTFDRKTA